MSNITDRRFSVRVPVAGHRELPAALRDVSLGGFSLALGEPLPLGSVHDFDLTVGRGMRIVLRARVVHQEPERQSDGSAAFVTGLQFIADMTPGVVLPMRQTA